MFKEKSQDYVNRMRFVFTIAYTYLVIDYSIIKKYTREIYLHVDASNASVSRNHKDNIAQAPHSRDEEIPKILSNFDPST